MNKYRFRLKTVHRLYIAQRDQQRAALAEGYRAEQILAERQAALTDETAELRETQRAAMVGSHTNINHLVEAQRYEMVLKAQEQQLADQAVRLAIEVERRRLALVEADRAVRVLDKLDERRRGEHRRQTERREAKQLDDAALFRRRTI